MAIRGKQELLDNLRERLGEDASDESIALLEDISDTLTDYETRTADSTDWRIKYEENDKAWRTRYMARFSGREENRIEDIDEEPEDTVALSYEDLFKEE